MLGAGRCVVCVVPLSKETVRVEGSRAFVRRRESGDCFSFVSFIVADIIVGDVFGDVFLRGGSTSGE